MARILVVDDEGSVRVALRKILQTQGHEIVEAEDGRLVLEKYRGGSPDAVLLDLYMPDVDGLEAMIRLKTEFPDAKVIAMSGGGWASKETVLDDAMGLGAVATLPKPFTAQEVLEVVAQTVGGTEDG